MRVFVLSDLTWLSLFGGGRKSWYIIIIIIIIIIVIIVIIIEHKRNTLWFARLANSLFVSYFFIKFYLETCELFNVFIISFSYYKLV